MTMSPRRHIIATVYDKRGRVLATGTNSYTRTHPLQQRYNRRVGGHPHRVFIHAEVAAIVALRNSGQAHKAYRIVVQRYMKDGAPANAQPCASCMAALQDLTNIRIIQHT